MKKLNISLTLAITLGLLIVCAYLPQLVSSALDTQSGKAPSYNEMHSIQLDLSSGQNILPIMGKLTLLRDAETVNLSNLSPSQTAIAEEEVYEAVDGFMQECESAGIFEWFEPSHLSMRPKLCFDSSDASNHLIYWTVTMINENEPNQTLLLDVDDETGKILCVTFRIYRSYSMDGVWERNKVVMDHFTDLYFGQLGLLEAAEAAEATASISGTYEYLEIDGGVSNAIYDFTDASYGKIRIQFDVDGAGGFMITFL